MKKENEDFMNKQDNFMDEGKVPAAGGSGENTTGQQAKEAAGNTETAGNPDAAGGSDAAGMHETASGSDTTGGRETSDNEATGADSDFADADSDFAIAAESDDEASGYAASNEPTMEEKLKQEIELLNDKHLRLFAEFDNFKRRSAKERGELIGTASKGIILNLLPVLDDFDRAQKSMESAADVQALKEGIELIIAKFRNILSQQGVKEMESVGTPFDPDLHEAVTNIPAPSEDMKGKVVDEVEKGYYLNDKVIRFAKVLVGA